MRRLISIFIFLTSLQYSIVVHAAPLYTYHMTISEHMVANALDSPPPPPNMLEEISAAHPIGSLLRLDLSADFASLENYFNTLYPVDGTLNVYSGSTGILESQQPQGNVYIVMDGGLASVRFILTYAPPEGGIPMAQWGGSMALFFGVSNVNGNTRIDFNDPRKLEYWTHADVRGTYCEPGEVCDYFEYSLEAVTAVPLPASFWFFTSGLMALFVRCRVKH